MTPREKWTDERLDDLNKKVDKGFEDVKGEFKDVRIEMRESFAHVDARFDALNRNLLIVAGTIIAALIGSTATLIGVVAF